ncbi:hypothetical protein BH24CHL8_BH24CHL8_10860 [soil metagenome]
MTTNSWLKVILALWVLGFLVVACGPAIAADGIGGTLIGGAFGLLLGSVLFVPWLVGVGILIVLIWLTKPRGRTPDHRYPDDRYPR